jgi:hypothetical protein
MTVVALVFLLTSDVSGRLTRVEDPSYPEKQAGWFKTHEKVPDRDVDDDVENGELAGNAAEKAPIASEEEEVIKVNERRHKVNK